MNGKNGSGNSQPERLSIRWALIFLCGLVASLVGGGLALLGQQSLPESVLAAFLCAGATISWMHRMVA